MAQQILTLVNVLIMCDDVPPAVVVIHDCTDHMAAGGKKDAEYLAGVMGEEIFKFDSERMNTDFFYFDGAANVQRGSLRLCALYPTSYVFHGGEHVVSLLPPYIANIAPIKVSMCDFIFFVSFSGILLYCLTLNLLQI